MAIRSMTGFGVADRSWSERGVRVRVEVRSVNARFLEIKIRQPFGVAAEHALRRALEARLGRGRVDLSVRVEGAGELGDDPLAALGIDPARIDSVLTALGKLVDSAYQASFQVSHPSSLELLKFLISSGSGAGAGQGSAGDPVDEPPAFLHELVDEALARLLGMREAEGEALATTLTKLFEELEGAIATAERSLEGEGERLQVQLRERVDALLARAEAGSLDSERLAQEIALVAVRGDVSEELARIASHLGQARALLRGPAEVGQGKTLDFLSQELLREVTTIGSKITSHTGSAVVIAAKGSIERIREQVLNVE
jgi:uncharacterized protein (TIGR00255 family)